MACRMRDPGVGGTGVLMVGGPSCVSCCLAKAPWAILGLAGVHSPLALSPLGMDWAPLVKEVTQGKVL